MSLEIYVHGDIERAIRKLKRQYQLEIFADIFRHSFFESKGARRRRNIRRAKKRKLKMEQNNDKRKV